MAQLCVNLLPGDGITAEQLQKATVHLKQAKAYFTMNTDGEPVIHNHDGEASTPYRCPPAEERQYLVGILRPDAAGADLCRRPTDDKHPHRKRHL